MTGETTTLQPGQSIRPNVSVSKARELVQQLYGVQVESIKELNSYDDNNFYVKGTICDGHPEKFIFKVLNSMDSKKTGHIEAEHAAMKILSENGLNCPVPLKNVHGETFSLVTIQNEPLDKDNNESSPNESCHIVRLLTFVEGKIMHEVPPTPKLLEKSGKYLANVQSVLKGQSFPALENHASVWYLSHVMELEKFVFIVKDQPDRFNLVSEVLTSYKTKVLPIMAELDKGVFHGDFNEQNIIVRPSSTDPGDYDVHGLIDFGDMQSGPYVFDVAVTVCYMMLECVKDGVNLDPFEGAQNVLKGFTEIKKLSEKDLQVLRILVACRLCQSLVMGAYTYSLNPGNEYLLTTAKTGWALLERVWREKTDEQVMTCWNEAVVQKQ